MIRSLKMQANKRLASVLIAASLAISAADANAVEQWYQDFVKSVYPLANGDFAVTFATSPPSCFSSTNPKYFHVELGKRGVTSEGLKALLATALTAFSAGKRLTVVFDDATTSCLVNRMLVSD